MFSVVVFVFPAQSVSPEGAGRLCGEHGEDRQALRGGEHTRGLGAEHFGGPLPAVVLSQLEERACGEEGLRPDQTVLTGKRGLGEEQRPGGLRLGECWSSKLWLPAVLIHASFLSRWAQLRSEASCLHGRREHGHVHSPA